MGPRYKKTERTYQQRPQQYERRDRAYQTYPRPDRTHTQKQNFQNWNQRNGYANQDIEMERVIEIMRLLRNLKK